MSDTETAFSQSKNATIKPRINNTAQNKYYVKHKVKILKKIKERNDRRKEEKEFQCLDCAKTYTDNRNLQKHLNGSRHAKKIDKNNTFYICKECNYSTEYKQNYNTHLKSKKHARNTKKLEQNKIRKF